jgi:hypothetical protein
MPARTLGLPRRRSPVAAPDERRSVKTANICTPGEAEVGNAAFDAMALEFNGWSRPILIKAARRDAAVNRPAVRKRP